jgi:hypothetical protein
MPRDHSNWTSISFSPRGHILETKFDAICEISPVKIGSVAQLSVWADTLKGIRLAT